MKGVGDLLLALGTPLPVTVRPWKFFEVESVMVSAYYILKSKTLRKKVYEKGIKDVLDFDGTVILDSGAFQALQFGRGPNVNELMDAYKKIEDADIKLSLDWPEDKIIENYNKLCKLEVLPVLSAESLEHISFFEHVDCEWLFVGRLAKILRHFGRNGFETLDEKLALISSVTIKRIWALGVGNWRTIPILAQNDVEGTDTSSYRIAAAFGDIIVPGIGTCHVSGRKIGKKNWGMRLAKQSDIQAYLDMLGLSFNDLEKSFEDRVLFNAFALEVIMKKNNES